VFTQPVEFLIPHYQSRGAPSQELVIVELVVGEDWPIVAPPFLLWNQKKGLQLLVKDDPKGERANLELPKDAGEHKMVLNCITRGL